MPEWLRECQYIVFVAQQQQLEQASEKVAWWEAARDAALARSEACHCPSCFEDVVRVQGQLNQRMSEFQAERIRIYGANHPDHEEDALFLLALSRLEET